jgi:hypothetical protein
VRFARLKRAVEQSTVEGLNLKTHSESALTIRPLDDQLSLPPCEERFEMMAENECEQSEEESTWPSIYPKIDFPSYMDPLDQHEKSEFIEDREIAFPINRTEDLSEDDIPLLKRWSSRFPLKPLTNDSSGRPSPHQQFQAYLPSKLNVPSSGRLGTNEYVDDLVNCVPDLPTTWGPRMQQPTNQSADTVVPPNPICQAIRPRPQKNHTQYFHQDGLELLDNPPNSCLTFEIMPSTIRLPIGSQHNEASSSVPFSDRVNWPYHSLLRPLSSSTVPQIGVLGMSQTPLEGPGMRAQHYSWISSLRDN